MKRFISIVLLLSVFLSGCGELLTATDAIAFRQKLQEGNGCRFVVNIQADHGDFAHFFSLRCEVDNKGTLNFTALEPQTISGISGFIDNQSGKLVFDETVLHFPNLAEGEIPPVCSPWLFYKALLGAYIRAEGKDGDAIRIILDDSFKGENISFEVWLKEGLPVAAEIFWCERNVLTLFISEFEIL